MMVTPMWEAVMKREKDAVERLSAQIVDWEAKIDRLQFQVETASDERKGAYQEELEKLRQRRDEAQAQLQRIGTGESDVGKDLREGTKDLGDDIKSRLRRAILKL